VIDPGESVQLAANLSSADGLVENVSSRAAWEVRSATTATVLSLTATGLATGGDRGDSVVTVRFDGRTAEAMIFVLPKGTFRLAGIVTEGGVGLEKATVTVLSGVGEGLEASSDFYGHYFLYGVAGPVEVRASKMGYRERTERINVTTHFTHFLQLAASLPGTDDYGGTYTLTFTAGACTPGFPEGAKRRVYTAAVGQSGSDLKVSLTGADFVLNGGRGNAFRGAFTPTGEISFWISPVNPWDASLSDLVERLDAGTALTVQGTITARRTSAGIFGLVSPGAGGSMFVADKSCSIDRFEMMRR
jgi:hypothetical protein